MIVYHQNSKFSIFFQKDKVSVHILFSVLAPDLHVFLQLELHISNKAWSYKLRWKKEIFNEKFCNLVGIYIYTIRDLWLDIHSKVDSPVQTQPFWCLWIFHWKYNELYTPTPNKIIHKLLNKMLFFHISAET